MSAARLLTRRLSRTSLVVAAAAGVAVSTLAVAAVPAQAASGIGKGRAVVHVDSAQATTVMQADGSYLLSMPQGTTGQWMGERKVAGKTKVLVGNLTGEKLASNWSNLKYTASGVVGTLKWGDAMTDPKGNTTAVVRVSKPQATGTGVTFVLQSQQELPATMANVILSLDRAPQHKSTRSTYPLTQTAVVSGNLSVSVANSNADTATFRIFDSSGATATCFTGDQTATNNAASVGSRTCAGNFTYADNSMCWYNDKYYVNCGVSSSWGSSSTSIRSGLFSLFVTPKGQSTYAYIKSFQWK